MRQIALLLASVLIVSVVAAAQEHLPEYSAKEIGAQVIAQREAQTEKPGPPISLFAAPLVALEKDLVRAEKLHNLKFIDDALAPDFLEIAGDGRLYTKAEIMEVVKDIQVDDYALQDFRSVDVRDDVGVLTYTVTVRGSYKGQAFPFRNLLSSVWHRQKGRWRMVFHTSTPMPLPPGGTAELEGLEQDLVARQADEDVAWLKQVFSDDAIIVGPDGKRYSKAEMIEDMGHLPKMPRRISEVSARLLSPDSGVVTGRLEVKADDKILPYTSTTVWKRGPGGWQIVFHQDTVVK